MSDGVGRISESWTDDARRGALEARKRAHPDWSWKPTAAESKLGIVHVRSYQFRDPARPDEPMVGDFQSFTPDGRHANVRLHLDDEHPAVKDAQADFPDMHSDHFEFLETIPVRNVEAPGKNVAELGRSHAAEVDSRIQAAHRAEVVRQNQMRRASVPESERSKADRAARRRELSAGLRTTHRFPA